MAPLFSARLTQPCGPEGGLGWDAGCPGALWLEGSASMSRAHEQVARWGAEGTLIACTSVVTEGPSEGGCPRTAALAGSTGHTTFPMENLRAAEAAGMCALR